MVPLPQSLKNVAYLFIVGGILSALDIVFSLLSHRININLGVLCIFVGQGLLRLNPRSLAWAMFFVWLGLIFLPLFALIFLFVPGELRIFGVYVGQAPPGLGFLLCLGALALTVYEYRVLTDPKIRQLFTSRF